MSLRAVLMFMIAEGYWVPSKKSVTNWIERSSLQSSSSSSSCCCCDRYCCCCDCQYPIMCCYCRDMWYSRVSPLLSSSSLTSKTRNRSHIFNWESLSQADANNSSSYTLAGSVSYFLASYVPHSLPKGVGTSVCTAKPPISLLVFACLNMY